MATKIAPNRILPYDPDMFHNQQGFAGQGICSSARFCGSQPAEFMIRQRGRGGDTWIGLCRGHAAQKAGGEEFLP